MKLASIEKIKQVIPHPNADRLDLVYVLGFQCVVDKDLYKDGDIIVYIQPDSLLPVDAEWAKEYRKYSPDRIRAVKLRDKWSEGIIVPLELLKDFIPDTILAYIKSYIGTDISKFLGITKYEPPETQEEGSKRYTPFSIPETKQERWENIIDELPIDTICDVTLKEDGKSWSAFYNIDTKEFGISGRVLEYHEDFDNAHTKVVKKYNIKEKLINFCEENKISLCLRGEVYGQGVSKGKNNPRHNVETGLAIFDVYKIKEREYARIGDFYYFRNVANFLSIPHVEVIESNIRLTRDLIRKYSEDLKIINGKHFEGVVIKHNKGSFKIINKHYDSKK